jgi:adenosine deaminase
MDNHPSSSAHPPSGTTAWSHRLPKIDLHRHFEGSLRFDTLLKITYECGVPLPSGNPETLLSEIQINHKPRDFPQFLRIFEILNRYYISKEVIQRLTGEIIADAAHDNVKYLELRFNPLTLAKTGDFKLNDVVEWVMQASAQAQEFTGTRTCLILQIPRREPLMAAEEIVDIAASHLGAFVRGIDLAGDEENYPPGIFAHPLQRAQDAGLNITIHAGEVTGAQSVYDAVTYLRAQRIGHGINAIKDPSVIDLLLDRGITLEVCPTSNIKTGLIADYAHHPLTALTAHGLRITLNTDDPSIFGTTASQEMTVATQEIGIPRRFIYRFLRYGVESAFIPSEERPWLRDMFQQMLTSFPEASEAYAAAV